MRKYRIILLVLLAAVILYLAGYWLINPSEPETKLEKQQAIIQTDIETTLVEQLRNTDLVYLDEGKLWRYDMLAAERTSLLELEELKETPINLIYNKYLFLFFSNRVFRYDVSTAEVNKSVNTSYQVAQSLVNNDYLLLTEYPEHHNRTPSTVWHLYDKQTLVEISAIQVPFVVEITDWHTQGNEIIISARAQPGELVLPFAISVSLNKEVLTKKSINLKPSEIAFMDLVLDLKIVDDRLFYIVSDTESDNLVVWSSDYSFGASQELESSADLSFIGDLLWNATTQEIFTLQTNTRMKLNYNPDEYFLGEWNLSIDEQDRIALPYFDNDTGKLAVLIL